MVPAPRPAAGGGATGPPGRRLVPITRDVTSHMATKTRHLPISSPVEAVGTTVPADAGDIVASSAAVGQRAKRPRSAVRAPKGKGAAGTAPQPQHDPARSTCAAGDRIEHGSTVIRPRRATFAP